jgi:hypothetical protein
MTNTNRMFIDAGGAYIDEQGRFIISEIHLDITGNSELATMTNKEVWNFIGKEYFNGGRVNWLIIQ